MVPQNVLVVISTLGALLFLLVGVNSFFSGLRKSQRRNNEKISNNASYLTMGGIGMILLALFVCSFIISVLNINFTIRFVTIFVGIVCFGLPSVSLMLVSIIRYIRR